MHKKIGLFTSTFSSQRQNLTKSNLLEEFSRAGVEAAPDSFSSSSSPNFNPYSDWRQLASYGNPGIEVQSCFLMHQFKKNSPITIIFIGPRYPWSDLWVRFSLSKSVRDLFADLMCLWLMKIPTQCQLIVPIGQSKAMR